MTVKLEDVKEPEKGYVTNCLIMPKRNSNGELVNEGVLFGRSSPGYVTAHLDGYAIIPIEEYNRLIEKFDD